MKVAHIGFFNQWKRARQQRLDAGLRAKEGGERSQSGVLSGVVGTRFAQSTRKKSIRPRRLMYVSGATPDFAGTPA